MSEHEPKEISKQTPTTILKKYYSDIEASAKKRKWLIEKRKEARKRVEAEKLASLDKISKSSFINHTCKKHAFRKLKLQKPKLRIKPEIAPLYIAIRSDVNLKPESVIARLLKDLHLAKPLHISILKNNEENTLKLRQLGPFVFYGTLSLPVLEAIIARHAAVKTSDDKKELLDSNLKVENHFGDLNIFSLDELIHFIYEANDQFDCALKRLAPIRLSNCKVLDTTVSESPKGYVSNIKRYILQYLN